MIGEPVLFRHDVSAIRLPLSTYDKHSLKLHQPWPVVRERHDCDEEATIVGDGSVKNYQAWLVFASSVTLCDIGDMSMLSKK